MLLNEPQEALATRDRIGGTIIDGDIAKKPRHPHRRYAKHGDGGSYEPTTGK